MVKNNQETVAEDGKNKVKNTKKLTWRTKTVVFLLLVLMVAGAALWWKLQITNNTYQELQSLKADYDGKLTQVVSRVEQLETTIANMQKAHLAISSDVMSATEINKKIDNIENNVAEQLAKLESSGVVQVVPDNNEAKMQQEVLLAAGVMTVRDLAEQGLSFAYEAEVLKIMAQGNDIALKYIDTIQKYAASGIKGKSALINEFKTFYPYLAELKKTADTSETVADEVQEKTAWWKNMFANAWDWIRGVFVNKKAEPQVKPKFDEKIYAAINNGDLTTVLKEIKSDAVYGKTTNSFLQYWIAQTEVYLDFENAVRGLLMNSMANLRLKEMEH